MNSCCFGTELQPELELELELDEEEDDEDDDFYIYHKNMMTNGDL